MANNPAEKLTINITDICVRAKLYDHILKLIKMQEGYQMRPLVMLCIGSDRYTGDSLGPLVGSHLQEYTSAIVYGSLESPVHAGNLVETLKIINLQYHHSIILAVDACLGKPEEVGNMEAWAGGLQAGIAVGNKLPCVGHVSVIGVVNSGSQIGYLDLQHTPLSIVMKLSKVIAGALEDVTNTLTLQQSGIQLSV